MSKFLKILLYSLLVFSGVIIVLFYVQSSNTDFSIINMGWIMSHLSMVDGLIWWAYLMVFVSIILLIVLAIVGMVKNPKVLKKVGIIFGIAVLLVGSAYLLASGTVFPVNLAIQPSAATFKMTDMLLIMVYELFSAAFLALIVGGIRNMIQKR